MKVVHLIASFSPAGAELLVKDIALHMDKSIIVEIWAVGEGENKEFEECYKDELAKFNIVCINIGKKAGSDRLKVFSQIRNLVRKRKPDIINAHSELSAFYASAATIGLKVIIIETIHNTVITYPMLQRYFTRFLIKKYVAISSKCRELIKREIRVKDKKIQLIYNGINIQNFQKQQRQISKAVENIIVIGRLDKQKDHHTLLCSYEILARKLELEKTQVPLLNIVGSGILKDELKSLTKDLEIEKYVNFLGIRNDIADLLYKNDIWVMSSKWEGLSIALLEAMATQIPIIATNVGSNSELISDGVNGILIEKESVMALAEGLYKLINSYDKRLSLSAANKEKILAFNIENCANNYSTLYFDLIHKHNKNLVKNPESDLNTIIKINENS